MFKLAQISDVHLPMMSEPGLAELLSKRITGYLNWKLNRSHGHGGEYLDKLIAGLLQEATDHVVITGDLVNLSLPAEFENARHFLGKLGTPDDVTTLCGNHDAYVPGALTQAFDAWQPYLSSGEAEVRTMADYPVLRKRGPVALITCNSAEATLPFFATGYFRKDQADRLAGLLKETNGMCRVVAIHHPPIAGAAKWYKRLIGQDLFRSIVRQHGAELVLHGHTHLDTIHQMEGPKGNIPVVCVPAAGNDHGRSRPAGRYNLFSIQENTDHWAISMMAKACKEDGSGVEPVFEREFSLAK